MAEDWTPGEMWRRMDSLVDGMNHISRRLDQMPNTQLMVELFKQRDQRIDHVVDDVREIRDEIVKLRNEHDGDLKEIRDDAASQRRLNITTAIAVGGLICTIIGTIIAVARFA